MKQRSPVIFWLLLAATLAVDAVAVVWLFTAERHTAAETLVDALSFSQISVACVWWMQATIHRRWKAAAPVVVAVAAAIMTSRLPYISLIDAAALYGSHLIAVAAALWLAKRTTWIRRGNRPQDLPTWQFSVAQLLLVMTLLAILLVALKSAELVRDAWAAIVAVITGNVALIVGVLFVWYLRQHTLVRLAIMLVVAAVVALANGLLRPYFLGNFVAYYVIQTLVLWLWLELGRIVPSDEPALADGSPSAAAGPDRRA
jgi:hypothetical protein